MEKIKSFYDLIAWQEGHKLVLDIYKTTSTFPQQEVYALTSQMRRAAVSITSNIAEGFSRRGKKEKMQFYSMAQGSLTELQNQLLVAKDVGYVKNDAYILIFGQTQLVHKLITGLIKSVNNFN